LTENNHEQLVGETCKRTGASQIYAQTAMLTSHLSTIRLIDSIFLLMHDRLDVPLTLLQTETVDDFHRNLRKLEKNSERKYSLLKTLREATPGNRLSGLEMETHQELAKLYGKNRNVHGTLVPVSVFTRDLTTTLPTMQTTVSGQVAPFLRPRTIAGRCGATILEVAGGNFKLPRQIGTAGAQWLPETGGATTADPQLDSITFQPSRIMGKTMVSAQLLKQSSVDIEQFVANDLARAIATAVDAATLYGSGVNQPTGILNIAANGTGQYAYNKRSAPVSFGGAATWPKVLQFELMLESGLIDNDGTFAFIASPTVRDKWAQASKVAGYPSFLWEQGDDPIFGSVNGRPALSTTQVQNNTVLFGRWSDCLIAQWIGVDVLSNAFTYATTAEVEITANLLVDIEFRYALSFCSSLDSGAQ
jgi:hypothetical protein